MNGENGLRSPDGAAGVNGFFRCLGKIAGDPGPFGWNIANGVRAGVSVNNEPIRFGGVLGERFFSRGMTTLGDDTFLPLKANGTIFSLFLMLGTTVPSLGSVASKSYPPRLLSSDVILTTRWLRFP